jgi:hypothetical protein
MTWSFNMRLDMRDGFWLEGSETSWVVDYGEDSGHEVTMHSQTLGRQQETLPLALARRVVVHGIGYATEAEARKAAKLWRAWFMAAFASLRIGVDFGDRASRAGSRSRRAGTAVADPSGRSAIDYPGGISVYESKSPPFYMPAVPATGTVVAPKRLPAAIAAARSTGGLSLDDSCGGRLGRTMSGEPFMDLVSGFRG